MNLSRLFHKDHRVSTSPVKIPEALIFSRLSASLSKCINPHHLGSWLKLHFGRGNFRIKARDGMYEIWAPRKIQEVSIVPKI